jgi:flagellar biogenesis protein FliO
MLINRRQRIMMSPIPPQLVVPICLAIAALQIGSSRTCSACQSSPANVSTDSSSNPLRLLNGTRMVSNSSPANGSSHDQVPYQENSPATNFPTHDPGRQPIHSQRRTQPANPTQPIQYAVPANQPANQAPVQSADSQIQNESPRRSRQLTVPSDHSLQSIPEAIRAAISPQSSPPTTTTADTRFASQNRTAAQPTYQDHQVQPVTYRQPVQPARAEMTADFAKLPGYGESISEPQQPLKPNGPRTLGEFLQTALPAAKADQTTERFASGELLQEKGQPMVRTGSSRGFQELLQRIATSTCLVIILGIGFILVAKRFMTNAPGKPSKGPSKESIQIVNSIRLNPKSNLHLVEVASQRVLVACDLNGIKSVVSLTPSFAETFDEYHEESPVADPTESSSNDKTTAEIEAEMQEKLSQILGGQAFKDVFLRDRAVA